MIKYDAPPVNRVWHLTRIGIPNGGLELIRTGLYSNEKITRYLAVVTLPGEYLIVVSSFMFPDAAYYLAPLENMLKQSL